MGFHGYYYSPPSSSLLSSSFISIPGRFMQLKIEQVIGNLVSLILSLIFAVVGTVVGTLMGGIVGQEATCGFIHGVVIGTISGASLSIEVFESFRRLWLSGEKRIHCLLYLIDVIGKLASGRLVRERVGPMLFNTVHAQLSTTTMEDTFDIFDTGCGYKGLSEDIIQKIPQIKITTKNCFDSGGDRIPCSVCLQDFQVAEQVRKLPYCHHMFHTACIDQWLMRHASCPLCRTDL